MKVFSYYYAKQRFFFKDFGVIKLKLKTLQNFNLNFNNKISTQSQQILIEKLLKTDHSIILFMFIFVICLHSSCLP